MDALKYCTFHFPLDDYKSTFNLEKAVCNHGLFMMAPNLWVPLENCLARPLRLADGSSSVTVSITHPLEHNSLLVKVHGIESISTLDKEAILVQVARMLRLSSKDEKDVEEFHKLHPEARERGFGRLFRSPTMFEDVVKCILLSNCQWQRSMEMARSLCKLQLKLSNGLISSFDSNVEKRGLKRNRVKLDAEVTSNMPCENHMSKSCESDNIIQSLGNFPTATELANLSVEVLNKHCNLGYRAGSIIDFAKRIESGKLNLESSMKTESSEELFRKLKKVKGIGPSVGASIMMCFGFYDRVPMDSETKRHFQEVHGVSPKEKETTAKRKGCKRNCSTKMKKASTSSSATWNQTSMDLFVEKFYGRYAPFQCLAFWMELINYYESKLGKLRELARSEYHLVTGSVHYNSAEVSGNSAI